MLHLILALLSTQQEVPAPVFADTVLPLPAPTGRHSVGTTTAYLVDSTRTDGNFPGGRPITVQLWYPALHDESQASSYLQEPGLPSLLLRIQYYGIDSAALGAWPTILTHSRVNPPPDRGPFPLITFSVGLGLIRANYTTLAEELASHGFIVALVETPLAGTMISQDGREIMDTIGITETPAGHRAAVVTWSRDVRFALDQMQLQQLPGESGRVARVIDWGHVGAAGHSSGGLVAIATCEADERVRACVDLDGGMASPSQEPMADFVSHGVTKPTLLLRSRPIYGDADFARRGITRAQWEKRGEGGKIALDSLIQRSHGNLRVGGVAGTGHMSFTDAPFVMASTITRFGGMIIAPNRGLLVISSAVRAFFDEEFSIRPGAMAEVTQRFSELTIENSAR
ncbi:MAG: hypothetical protein ABI613_11475 [Gemmatimonadota bacterium]